MKITSSPASLLYLAIESQIIVAESMILMGYVTSLFIDKYHLAAGFRIDKINCNPSEILTRYNDSDI